MKFAYFYASSPEIIEPNMPTYPPLSGEVCIRSGNLPRRLEVALNVAIVGIQPVTVYSLEVNVYFEGNKLDSTKDEYEPFRRAHYFSPTNEISTRYSFLESFIAEKPGIYTFHARLYDRELPKNDEMRDDFVHQSECSIAVAEDWR